MKHKQHLLSTTLWLLIAWTVLSAAAQTQPSPATLLQQAIFAEETEGDLEAAMTIYRQIVTQGNTNRPILAKAQFRLGTCQIKSGNIDQAVKIFQTLLTQFPDLTAINHQARSELRRLNHPPQTPITSTVIPGLGSAAAGLLSPDESKIAFVNWDQEGTSKIDLLIKTLGDETGVPVTQTAYASDDTYEFANFNYNNGGPGTWSPDSQQVAYLWFTGNDVQVKVAKIDGTESRQVPVPKESFFSPYDWSSQGPLLLGLEYSDPSKKPHIAIAKIGSGQIERLTSKPGAYSHPRFSPDGQWVVAQQDIGGQSRIIAIGYESKQVIQLTQSGFNETAPIVSADNKQILFSSDRSGSWDLWTMPTPHSLEKHSPKLIQPNVDQHPKRITQNGKICLNSKAPNNEIYTIHLPEDTSQKAADPMTLSVHHIGTHLYPCWASDGQRIAARHGTSHICIQNRSTGKAEVIDPQVRHLESLFWSPDGNRFAFSCPSGPQGPGIYLLHLTDNNLQKLTPHPDARNRGGLGFSVSGQEFGQRLTGSEPGIVWTDITTGIHRIESIPGLPVDIEHLAIAPDSSKLAFVPQGGKSVRLLDRSNGQLTTLDSLTEDNPAVFGAPSWSPDRSKLAYFGDRFIRVFDLESLNKTQLLEEPDRGSIEWWKASPRWHPSGKQISFGWLKKPHHQIQLLEY